MPTYEQIADQTHQSDPDLSNLAEHGGPTSYYSTWTEIITRAHLPRHPQVALQREHDPQGRLGRHAGRAHGRGQTLVGRITAASSPRSRRPGPHAAQRRGRGLRRHGRHERGCGRARSWRPTTTPNTILAATSDDTPVALTVAEQTLIGRITGGAIAALTALRRRGC